MLLCLYLWPVVIITENSLFILQTGGQPTVINLQLKPNRQVGCAVLYISTFKAHHLNYDILHYTFKVGLLFTLINLQALQKVSSHSFHTPSWYLYADSLTSGWAKTLKQCWFLTKKSELQYSTALDRKWQIRTVKDGDKVIIWKRAEKLTMKKIPENKCSTCS